MTKDSNGFGNEDDYGYYHYPNPYTERLFRDEVKKPVPVKVVPPNEPRAPSNDPFGQGLMLLAVTMGGNNVSEAGDAIERQAQSSLVNSTTLPTDHNDSYDKRGSTKKALIEAGVVFGEVVPGDSLFQHVKLPPGWGKQRTDHYLWSDLVDDKGRKRASIFYKGSAHDREAFMSVTSRFAIRADLKLRHAEEKYRMQVFDGETLIFSTEAVEIGRKDYATQDRVQEEQRQVAREWLAERYPNWQDPAAHWNDP